MIEIVNPDNFVRAESDAYFAAISSEGGFGRFVHHRELEPIDRQTVVRSNRDTLYSVAVFDLDAGPVAIAIPEPGRRFLSMMVIDEDQYAISVVYRAGTYTLTREDVGTRYTLVGIRILVDPRDPADVSAVHALQDAITVEQARPGSFEIPQWDSASQARVRDALIALGATIPDSHRMFGTRDDVEPVRHLIGTAMAWGGNPEKDATYLNVTPARNDGITIYRLTVRDVPVDGFWSVSVYNARGYFEPNEEGAYSINNVTAKRDADGAVTIQFGGIAPDVNCLPITPGWNYTVRLYLPRTEILTGAWKFPVAEPVTPTFLQAVDVADWAAPLARFDAMREAYYRDAKARPGDVVYWSERLDWRAQLATPTCSAYYALVYFTTQDGPVILETPPVHGTIVDAWQQAVVEIGPDSGRYLLLPPGDRGTRLPGTLPLRLRTFNGSAIVRAPTVGAVRAVQVYPAATLADPPATHLIDVSGEMFDAVLRYDDTMFERVARMVDEEPFARGELDKLAAIGIARGKHFAPDADMRLLLSGAARATYAAILDAAPIDGALYWPDRRWRWPTATAELDVGVAIVQTFVDHAGWPLGGDRAHTLRVPPAAPSRAWALTVYDAATFSFIRDVDRVEVSSRDGVADIVVAPSRPTGVPAAGWIASVPGRRWFAMFRWIDPSPALRDRVWVLPDFESREA